LNGVEGMGGGFSGGMDRDHFVGVYLHN